MNLNESIIKIRVDLQNRDIKKSGKNAFARYGYFELKDFLPHINELMLEEKVNDVFTIENGEVVLRLVKGEEVNEYKMPFTLYETPQNKNGTPSMQDIQYLGALTTYYKRYIYMNAFGITDGEVIDAMDNNDLNGKQEQPKQNKPSADYQPPNEEDMKQQAIEKGIAILQHTLDKTEHKPTVLQKFLKNHKWESMKEVTFTTNNDFKELHKEIKDLIQVEIDIESAGI